MDVPFILQFVLICFDLQAMQVLMPVKGLGIYEHMYLHELEKEIKTNRKKYYINITTKFSLLFVAFKTL